MISSVCFHLSLATFVPTRILRISLSSFHFSQQQTVTLLKSIQRALRPTAIKTSVVCCALLSHAIVSRIQKPVTLRAVVSAPEIIVPAPIPPTPLLAAPLIVSPPASQKITRVIKKAGKKRAAATAVKVSPLVVAEPLVAAVLAVPTKSPAPRVIDVEADLALLSPSAIESPNGQPPKEITPVVVAKEEEAKEDAPKLSDAVNNSPMTSPAIPPVELVSSVNETANLTAPLITEALFAEVATPIVAETTAAEDHLIDSLLSEDHNELEAINSISFTETTAQAAAAGLLSVSLETNFSNAEELNAATKEALSPELTNVQKEGELQVTDFSSYDLRLADLSGQWRAAKKEFGAALKEENAEQRKALGKLNSLQPTDSKNLEAVTDTYLEKSALPEETAQSVAAETHADALTQMAALRANEPEELPTSERREPEPMEVTPEPELVAASSGRNYRRNEKETEEDGPQLVAPAKFADLSEKDFATTPAPEPELVATQPKVTVSPAAVLSSQSRATTNSSILAAATVSATPKFVFDASADIAKITGAPQKPVVVASASEVGPSLVSAQDAAIASVRSAASGMPELTQKHITRSVAQATAAAEAASEENQEGDETDDQQAEDEVSEVADGGQVFGRLLVDAPLNSWLDQKKGHIELSLKPVKGRNPADTIYFEPEEYSYPAEDFQFSTEGLEGGYRLLAGFFVPGVKDAVAKIALPETVSAQSYKKKLQFKLSHRDFERALAIQRSKARGLSMALTVFEGASGNYKSPKAITSLKKARVTIEAFPELGTFYANKRGNILIPRVPSQSTLKIHAMADGYYDSYLTIATEASPVYSPLFLISKDKVDAVTRFFTKKPQSPLKGVIMGRVFDASKKRAPLAGEQVNLQHRKGRALYFSSLPDAELRETTNTGLFGFFNVGSVFRTLTRLSSDLPYLMNVPPNSAVYVELGRGGKKNLRGRVFDPLHQEVPQAAVRLLGSTKGDEVLTGESDDFTIPGIDFPAGTVLLEVQPQRYPAFLYDVTWSPRDREKQERFTVFSKETIEDSARYSGKQNWKSNLGTLIGGASAEFFKGRNECISVTLDNLSGAPLPEKAGPFLLNGQTSSKSDVVCLNAAKPRFSFFNLMPGEYVLKWRNATGQTIRTRVVHVKLNSVSVAID